MGIFSRIPESVGFPLMIYGGGALCVAVIASAVLIILKVL